jgi:hypothetical protein
MKFILRLIVFTFFGQSLTFAQNPMGVYLDIDGKVKFWLDEPNRNGNVDDTVYLTYGDLKELIDLRNLKYDYLTLIEAPRRRATSISDMDPSIHYDTTEVDNSETDAQPITLFNNYSLFQYECAKTFVYIQPDSNYVQKTYWDDIRGAGLNDSTIKEVKDILVDYVNRISGKWESYEEREALHAQLSEPDTIIEKKAVYDYLVDLFVVHDYDKENRLIRVIGYHWNYGVEVDLLNYDTNGNLIYFCRDKIGSSKHEFFFQYNTAAQVVNVCYKYSFVGTNESTPQYAYPEFQETKYTYSQTGVLTSKSELQDDNSWSTVYYNIINGFNFSWDRN